MVETADGSDDGAEDGKDDDDTINGIDVVARVGMMVLILDSGEVEVDDSVLV
jgi:hypothetical protein